MNESLSALTIGKPIHVDDLALVPLLGKLDSALVYEPYVKVAGSDLLQVGEVGSGVVNTVWVHNGTGTAVLFRDGEQLVGAKQNRVMNVSVMVGVGGDVKVPVTCEPISPSSGLSSRTRSENAKSPRPLLPWRTCTGPPNLQVSRHLVGCRRSDGRRRLPRT